MITQTFEKTQIESSEAYQMIKDEHLASIVITNQILAGSRVSLSSYRQVVFSECVFYAVEFQGVIFENCIFENCNFEFSHIRKCKFINCSFTNCNWTASTTINTIYESCELDIFLADQTCGQGNDVSYPLHESNTTDIYIELLSA